jgi:voltage-gated potassium channel
VNFGAKFRRILFQQIEPTAWPYRGLSQLNWLLVVAILLATVSAILETEPVLVRYHAADFRVAEQLFGVVFVTEYIARFWTSAERPSQLPVWRKRAGFVFSLPGMIDLLVIVATFSTLVVGNVAALRLLRLLRILRLAKLGRMSLAMRRLQQAVVSRRYELGLTMGLAFGLLILGASTLYFIEGELQPDKFGSIPRALWWAVITMTTIGYGDVYPITALGKIVAAFVAIAGIGLIAMPTGILAAAFSDAMQKEHEIEG